jgi:pyroglutamyl-peptidase
MDDATPNILLTGFQPFNGRSVNGSQTVAESLGGKTIREHRIQAEVFPVVWEGLIEKLGETLVRTNPVLVLGFGEGSKDYPCFESYALNETSGVDEEGKEPSKDLTEITDLPVRKTTMTYERDWFAGLPTRIAQSETPGKYLCNFLFYKTLSLTNARVGFVHLPVQGEAQNADYLSALVPTLYRLLSKNLNQILEGE